MRMPAYRNTVIEESRITSTIGALYTAVLTQPRSVLEAVLLERFTL